MQLNQTLYQTQSGVELIITPITLLTQSALQRQASERFPEPDRTPFEKPLENAFEEGDILPATENPDWQRLNQIQMQKRLEYFQELILNVGVTVADKEKFILAYIDQYEALDSDLFNLEFVGILNFFVCNPSEIAEIIRIILGKLPLTEVEIRDGLKFFRYVALSK